MPAFEALRKLRRRERHKAAKQEESLHSGPVPLHIVKSSRWYRVAYICLVLALITLTLNVPRSSAINRDGSYNRDVLRNVFSIFVVLIITFFNVQASDPGYLEEASLEERQNLLEERIEGSQFSNLTASNVPKAQLTQPVELSLRNGPVEDEDVDLKDDEEEESDDDEYLESSDESLILDIEPDENLDAQLSGIEASKIPLRAKYCRHSKRIVAKYDHYCAIIGTCIGEKNHCRFWWFLLFNTILLCYGIAITHSGFHDTPARVGTWLNHNGYALAMAIILWFLLVTFGGLWCFHCFLAVANMTSYEFMRADRISYLKGTKDFDLPFSNGLCSNLRYFCWYSDGMVARLRRVEWEPRVWPPVQPVDRNSENIYENIWENKYYSCC